MAATWSQASDGCEALGRFATNKEDWHLSGDVAVMHPDGYVEIKDRSKDIILKPNASTVSEAEVIQSCRQYLARFKVPIDAIAVLAPPQVPVQVLLPDGLTVDGRRVATLRTTEAPAGEDGVPD